MPLVYIGAYNQPRTVFQIAQALHKRQHGNIGYPLTIPCVPKTFRVEFYAKLLGSDCKEFFLRSFRKIQEVLERSSVPSAPEKEFYRMLRVDVEAYIKGSSHALPFGEKQHVTNVENYVLEHYCPSYSRDATPCQNVPGSFLSSPHERNVQRAALVSPQMVPASTPRTSSGSKNSTCRICSPASACLPDIASPTFTAESTCAL